MHRFVWDLHHERPAVANFTYPISATFQNTPPVPLGSWALPGTYTVRLTVDGRVSNQPLVVKLDPRAKASPADLELQYDTSRAIDAAMRRASAALAEIRRLTPKSALEERLVRASAPLLQLFGAVETSDAAPTP
ncbi:MAG: hypothetical protein ACRD2N_20630 [Vicinamibacterales bacterium]